MSDLWLEFEESIARYCEFISAKNFDYALNISIKHNYIYVENPKVACSTIKSVLQRSELNNPNLRYHEFNDIHSRAFSPLLQPSQLRGFDKFVLNMKPFKFCFVRNPYSRLLSAYLDKIHRDTEQRSKVLMALGRNTGDVIYFDDFVKTVCDQSTYEMDPHWRIQYYHTLQGLLDFDFVGRIEKFDFDIEVVLANLGINKAKFYSPEKRHAQEADGLLNDFYTPQLRSLVGDKYAVDFEYFGYER